MGIYQEWKKLLGSVDDSNKDFWDSYFKKEKEAYRDILNSGTNIVSGNLTDLAEGFKMTPVEFAGFMDGISESLNVDLEDLDSYDYDSPVELDINFEKLLFNMHKCKAPWLYNLKEWENVFSIERILEIGKDYNRSVIFVRGEKIGRNDPCPCGSGKKYKKCCGRNKRVRA